MNELAAFLIFGLLALAYHLTNDEPWTRIERRASQAIAALAGIGWMVERALVCQPLIAEGARYLILDEDTWTDKETLGDALGAFDLSEWVVDRFQGDVFAHDPERYSELHRLWYGFDCGPVLKYKARVFLALRHRLNDKFYCFVSGLSSDDIEALLRTFAGCVFSPAELAQVEARAKG